MKTVAIDNRLTVAPYYEALEGVETQFALTRFALRNLSKARVQQFFRDQITAVVDGMKHRTATLPAEVENAIPSFLKHWENLQKKKNRPADSRFKVELSEDRLNQSELLLLVAHFESFMKEIHRTFLIADPASVFGDSDTKVMLKEVFEQKTANPFDKFLREQIIKEVKWLDTQRIERRAKYFQECFRVSFGSTGDMERLSEIMKTRNKITHEIYGKPPRTVEEVAEQPLVSDEALRRARKIFRTIPSRCIQVGARNYPSYFH